MPGFKFDNREGQIHFGSIKVLDVNELVTQPTDPITLVADVATGTEDTVLSGNVLTNDTALIGSLTVSQFTIAGVGGVFSAGQTATIPSRGTFTMNTNGSWTLTPAANQNGVYPVVTYQATNGSSIKQSTLSITLTPVNDAPTAIADIINTQFNTPATFSPVANDTDPDGNALQIVQLNSTAVSSGSVVNVTGGSITLNSDNTLTFTPSTDYQGTFTFTYMVTDGAIQSSAQVTVTVGAAGGENGFATTFDNLYDSTWQPVNNTTVYQRQLITNPIGKSTGLSDPKWTDPAFGTKVFVTAAVTDFTDSENPIFVRNPYSKQQYYNADGTRVLLMASNSWWHLYDTATFSHIIPPGTPASGRLQITGGDNNDIAWDPVDPNVFYFASAQYGGTHFKKMNIVTGVVSVAFDFTSQLPAGFSQAVRFTSGGEGRPSADGKRWFLMAQTSSQSLIGFIAYDKELDEIVDYAVCTNKPDWVGMSNTGNYCVVAWSKGTSSLTMPAAQARQMDTADGTRAYPWGGLRGSTWTQLDNIGQHGDVAVDATGMDCWVSVSHSPYMDVVGTVNADPDGAVYYRRMDDGIPHVFEYWRAYWPGGTSAMHFSGAAFNRPGWALASYNSSGDPVIAAQDQTIVALELVPTNPRVYRILHHRTYASNYFITSFPAPNKDLTQILFSTDYLGTQTTYRQHMIGLPSWTFPTAGAATPEIVESPTLSGAFNSGGVLTKNSGTYTGTPTPSISGNWQSSADGITWADISGQTGNTYTVALPNSTRISWRERISNSGGFIYARSPSVIVGPLAAPQNTSLPVVPTTAQAEVQIDATAGVWSGNPIPTITRVWQRNINSTWTDSAFTTVDATFNIAGSWRLKETATNSQGTVTVYSDNITVSPAPVFPNVSNSYSMSGTSRTLEVDNAAWEGASTDYVVSSAGIQPATGWGSDVTRLELGGGANQAVEATMDYNQGFNTDCYVNLYICNTATQAGYRLNITPTQVRLYKNGTQIIEGGVNHNVNTATTALVANLTLFLGEVIVTVNGVEVMRYDDTAAPLTTGWPGFASYASGTPARTRFTSFKYSPAQ